VLRVNTTSKEEFRFWLTRRFTQGLWPLLQKGLRANPDVVQQSSAETRKAVLDFQQEAATQKMDTARPFKEQPTNFPLGDENILLTRAQMKVKKEGGYLLSMNSVDGKGVNFNLDNNVLHMLSKILVDILPKTGWSQPIPWQDPSGNAPTGKKLN
ncbi:MAG: hypothetical protein DSZ33_00605, partial [Gammaproteobacteria bacterium]